MVYSINLQQSHVHLQSGNAYLQLCKNYLKGDNKNDADVYCLFVKLSWIRVT
jgi:hypothetical protein